MAFPNNLITTIGSYLEREKKRAEKRLDDVSREDPFANTDRLIDNAASDTEAKGEEGHDRIEAIKHELSNYLHRVEQALSNIKKGKYGVCERCGKPIEAKRLEVMPTAVFCMSCEREKEARR